MRVSKLQNVSSRNINAEIGIFDARGCVEVRKAPKLLGVYPAVGSISKDPNSKLWRAYFKSQDLAMFPESNCQLPLDTAPWKPTFNGLTKLAASTATLTANKFKG